jgi:hypothetical protein
LLIKAELGKISQFKSKNHLSSYVRLVFITKRSGNISKEGINTKEGIHLAKRG